MSARSSFKSIENKHDVYKSKDCMKRFCESLREHTINIINFKNKKILVIHRPPASFIIIWIIGKNSMKHHCLKKKIFMVT